MLRPQVIFHIDSFGGLGQDPAFPNPENGVVNAALSQHCEC